MVPNGLNCQLVPGGGWGQSVARADCTSGSGLPKLDYYLFADQAAMNTTFNTYWPAGKWAPCPGMDTSLLPKDWRSPGGRRKVACNVANGKARVDWTIEPQLLMGSATGTDINSLYQWWAAHYE